MCVGGGEQSRGKQDICENISMRGRQYYSLPETSLARLKEGSEISILLTTISMRFVI